MLNPAVRRDKADRKNAQDATRRYVLSISEVG